MTFKQGDQVQYRRGVTAVGSPPDRRWQIGEVAIVHDLRGSANGMRITVRWVDGSEDEGVAAALLELA